MIDPLLLNEAVKILNQKFDSVQAKMKPEQAMTEFLYALLDVVGTTSSISVMQRALLKACNTIVMTGGRRLKD